MHRSDEPRCERAGGTRPGRGGWVDGAPPVTADEVATAADAGWADAAPAATGSWVRAAGAYVDQAPLPEPSEPALAAGVAPSRGPDIVHDHDRIGRWDRTGDVDDDRDDADVSGWNQLDEAARQAAMARHPAFRNQQPDPAERPAPVELPDPATGTTAGELLERLERGAARATEEAQLRSLAARALARLVPDGSVTWLAAAGDGRFTTWASTVAGHPDGACRAQTTASCPAATTGTTQVFDRSDELDACPHLVDDDRPACAATCVPTADAAVLLVRTPPGQPCPPSARSLVVRAAAVLSARAQSLHRDG